MRDRKGIGGRRRHGENLKRSPLNLTTTPELRARVVESAKAHGNTMTREVERLVTLALDFEAAPMADEKAA